MKQGRADNHAAVRRSMLNMVEQAFVIKQISVFLDNKPGSLARMARNLADRGINLKGLSLAETRDFGTVRLVVLDPDACIRALREGEYHYIETDVLAVEVADKPGGMADVLEIIDVEHLNVEYIYSMVSTRAGIAIVVLRVNDPAKACAALKAKGVKLLTLKDIASL
jgi:hypothetical protein